MTRWRLKWRTRIERMCVMKISHAWSRLIGSRQVEEMKEKAKLKNLIIIFRERFKIVCKQGYLRDYNFNNFLRHSIRICWKIWNLSNLKEMRFFIRNKIYKYIEHFKVRVVIIIHIVILITFKFIDKPSVFFNVSLITIGIV